MIDKTIAEHYKWGQDCNGWHLVKSKSLSVIQELMPPYTSEILHKHVNSRQFFFILSGEAIIEIEGEKQILQQGQGIEIAPGITHQMFNKNNKDLSFLVISCPPSHGDRINVWSLRI